MNIFFLSPQPSLCAEYLPDILLNKMIVETAQLLSSAHHIVDGEKGGLYKLTHPNHPCAIWTRKCVGNYDKLMSMFIHYCNEYMWRNHVHHGSAKMIALLRACPKGLRNGKATVPPQCMPDEFKDDSIYVAYRNYLKYKRISWANRDVRPIVMTWKRRQVPYWIV